MQSKNETQDLEKEAELSPLLVNLLKGVLYQDEHVAQWSALFNLQSRVRDYVRVLGLELILDEAEGYAFLRSREESEEEAVTQGEKIPRLIFRRQLSFPVSLLLALLRKKLAEFDAAGGETRLVLNRDQIVELIRLFLPDSSNEAKLVDQIERHIKKVVELGFLRRLKPTTDTQAGYEVRRIIKAYIDAQWLSEFDQKLETYREKLRGDKSDG